MSDEELTPLHAAAQLGHEEAAGNLPWGIHGDRWGYMGIVGGRGVRGVRESQVLRSFWKKLRSSIIAIYCHPLVNASDRTRELSEAIKIRNI